MAMAAVIGVSLCSAATFFVSITLIRFNLLSFRLHKLCTLVQSNNFQNTKSVNYFIYDEVKNLHQSHLSAIEYFEKCEYIGRKVLMILTTYVFVGLSFTGTMILFSLSIENYFLLVEMIISFIAVIFFAFLIGHFGQIVVNASDDIFYDW
ncbi:uncharacterized protein LOC106655982 [Trichogramma pretiosum]|uniref:uncharacterized protein LOC106655982 n=1 Tax=Trichogramma pretiosum TaxID=7493 RepID=UPI000C71A030|nr:uncharacterized protein LOC106655982 [Trichogramma pretiosum]